MAHSVLDTSLPARACAVLCVTALSFGLAACGAQEPPLTGQQVELARQAAVRAMRDDQAKAERVIEAAGGNVKRVARSEPDTDGAARTAKVSAGPARAPDRRAIRVDVEAPVGSVRPSGPSPRREGMEQATTLALSEGT